MPSKACTHFYIFGNAETNLFLAGGDSDLKSAVDRRI